MSKEKIWSRQGKNYINQGPKNQVTDKEAARSMADAEEKVRQKHERAVVNAVKAMGMGPGVMPHDEALVGEDVLVAADKASERVRSNIGGQNFNRAQQLFHLVELQPVDNPDSDQTPRQP